MKHLCQEGLAIGAIIDPPYLPWSVYAYSLDNFSWECLVGRNTNVMVYPFHKGTRVMSYLSSLFLFLSILAFEYLF